jgi:hypothetical protein
MTKSCSKCGEVKNFEDFPKRGDKLRAQCKICYNEICNKNLEKKKIIKKQEKQENIILQKIATEKKCNSCSTILSLEYFNKSSRNLIDGYDTRCKECIKKKTDTNHINIPLTKPTITEQKCKECLIIKDITQFHTCSKMKFGYRKECKDCHNYHRQEQRNMKIGFLRNLVDNSQTSSKKRNLEHTISKEFIFNLSEKQNDSCAITGSPLNYKTNSDWQCSLDRIDDSIGYIESNVRLITLEFNTPSKWSPDFIKNTIALQDTDIDYQKILTEIYQPITKKEAKYKWTKEIDDDGQETVFCHFCNTRKSIQMFNKSFNNGCKPCANSIKNFKQRFSRIYRDAKRHTTDRNKNKTGLNIQNFSITLEDLYDLYKQQRGKCFISNVPLHFNGEYCISIERINTDIGYTKENICLICLCFQSTQCQGGDNATGGRWTKDKWNLIVQ